MRTKKFMNVVLAGALVLSLVTINAKAGGGANSRFSVGAELGLPMGTFGDGSNVGFGGSLRYEMPMGDNLALMGTAGYLTFGGKDVTSGTPGVFAITTKSTASLIPIQVGAKYYFNEQQGGFYGMLQLGVTLVNNSFDITEDISGTSTTTSSTSSGSGFSYAPGIGYHLAHIDLGLSYQLFSQTTTVTDPFSGSSIDETSTGSYLGLRIAYVFGEK